jgi:hypothetical protein
MFTKEYLPSFGFVVLSIALVFSCLFTGWVLSPLDYEKAQYEEQKGHQLTKAGKLQEASMHFLSSAEFEANNLVRSRRYRCAGTTSLNMEDKIKYLRLALKFNPNNKNAKKELAPLFKEILYAKRYPDGWSRGVSGQAFVDTFSDGVHYTVKYHTDHQGNNDRKVELYLDGILLSNENILPTKRYKRELVLRRGKHTFDIKISDTFNPKINGMSLDDRDLGINYEIIKQ